VARQSFLGYAGPTEPLTLVVPPTFPTASGSGARTAVLVIPTFLIVSAYAGNKLSVLSATPPFAPTASVLDTVASLGGAANPQGMAARPAVPRNFHVVLATPGVVWELTVSSTGALTPVGSGPRISGVSGVAGFADSGSLLCLSRSLDTQGEVRCYDSSSYTLVALATGAGSGGLPGLGPSPRGLRFTKDGLALVVTWLGSTAPGVPGDGGILVLSVPALVAAGVGGAPVGSPPVVLSSWTSATLPVLASPGDVEVYDGGVLVSVLGWAAPGGPSPAAASVPPQILRVSCPAPYTVVPSPGDVVTLATQPSPTGSAFYSVALGPGPFVFASDYFGAVVHAFTYTPACPPGYSASSTAAGVCDLCPAGTYSGATYCTMCPVSASYSRTGSTSAAACVSCATGCDPSYQSWVTSPCADPTGWELWYDVLGVEGANSCLKRMETPAAWAAANASCASMGSGIHLMTVRQVRP
jgi:hypothetical protein